MADNADNLIPVFVDGIEVRVPPGTNMIEAARMVQKEIPHYCYHPHLSVPGNCRMCLVEMGMPGKDRTTGETILDADGKPKIMWMPKPTIACATKASPGLHIRTNSQLVRDCQKGVMEFLLINHPLDCPICDQAGECRLQEFATDYGRGYSRFVERKNVKPKRTRLGPRVILDDERCILCSRCIRFSREIAKDDVLGFTERGSYSTLTCFPGRQLENNYSLNTVDICPVGALTSTDFRFKMRVWFLKETPSICTESSVGVNTMVWSREGKIYRITPRRNDEVNDSWMSDSGRALYKEVESDNRLTVYSVEGRPVSSEEALQEAAKLIGEAKGLAVVGSGRASVEEQWLLRKIFDAAQATEKQRYLPKRVGESDGLLISADRNPNVRGALMTGLIDNFDNCEFDRLKSAIESGAVDTIIAQNECLVAVGIGRELLGKVKVIYLGTHHCEASQYAKVELPVLTTFEKDGTFINQQFRLQKFSQAVPGPEGVLSDIALLARLLEAVGGGKLEDRTPSGVWARMNREVPQFAGIDFNRIPATGQLLDGAAFVGLPFVEGKTLHYDPQESTAVSSSQA